MTHWTVNLKKLLIEQIENDPTNKDLILKDCGFSLEEFEAMKQSYKDYGKLGLQVTKRKRGKR